MSSMKRVTMEYPDNFDEWSTTIRPGELIGPCEHVLNAGSNLTIAEWRLSVEIHNKDQHAKAVTMRTA
jgi:hypothetical protein